MSKISKFKFSKTVIYIIIAISGIAIFLIVHHQTHRLVSSFLDRKLPKHIVLDYDNIQADLVSGDIALTNIKIQIYNRDCIESYAHVSLDKLYIKGFSYWGIWFQNELKAKKLGLENPKLTLYSDKKKQGDDKKKSGVVDLKREIKIDEFELTNGFFYVYESSQDSSKIAIDSINFHLQNVRIDSEIISQKIPIAYSSYQLQARNIGVNLSRYEKLYVSNIAINNRAIDFKDFRLLSKYSKEELSNHLEEEHEHITLKIPNIHINEVDYGYRDGKFYFQSEKIVLDSTHFALYLDKLQKDRTGDKKLYSAQLRSLPFDLSIDSIKINNSYISYSEKTVEDLEAGKVFFDHVNATITKLSNMYEKGNETRIYASSKFMGSTPLSLDWRFDVNNKNDYFTAKGAASNFNTTTVNQFLIPNQQMKIKGEIEQLYFNFHGDKNTASGDLKMKYDNVKLKLLKEDRTHVKKIRSAVGNMIIKDGDNANEAGFRYGEIAFDRGGGKSFFGYLWKSVNSGIKNALTGKAEKEED